MNSEQKHSLTLWKEFGISRSPILNRGNAQWPSNRILLQLASEYADGNAVTEAAERWVQESGCDWTRLINLRRPSSTLADEIKDVYLDPRPKRGIDLEGHGDRVAGAIPTSEGKVISWSLDGYICVVLSRGMDSKTNETKTCQNKLKSGFLRLLPISRRNIIM